MKASYPSPSVNRPRVLAVDGGSGAGAGADAVLWQISHNTNGSLTADQQWKRDSVPNYPSRYTLSNRTSNQFSLAIEDNAIANGTQVVQWWNNSDATNSFAQWTQEVNGAGNAVRYHSVANAKYCLAVAGAGNPDAALGAKVIIWQCDTGGADQWWFLNYPPKN